MLNLLDPNFYATIPLWIYLTGGFGIIILINSTVLCCYCCKIEKRKKELDLRESTLRSRELQFARKQQNRKIEDEELDNIVISKPMTYSEFSRNI